MAPYNLSDLAVKEIKISGKQLSPQSEKSYTGNFLLAHFLDFWALFWGTTISIGLYKASLAVYLNTEGLRTAWDLVDFSAANLFGWSAFAFSYFFFSYFFNDGQTWGMKLTKCRISMGHHDARNSLRWAVFSLSVYFTLGLSYKKGMAWLAPAAKVTSHDHLWHELVAQKDVAAPDVMSLVKEEEEKDFAEAA